MQPLRERSRELFSTFSIRFRSNQVCSKYPHFRTLLDYLNEKYVVYKLYYVIYPQHLNVLLDGMDYKFAEEVILPWINDWAVRNYRAAMNPHLHAGVGHEHVLVEVPLTMYENNAIQNMISNLEKGKGRRNTLEALHYGASLRGEKL